MAQSSAAPTGLLRAQQVVIAVTLAGSVLIAWPSRTEAYGLPKATLVAIGAVVVLSLAAANAILSRRIDIPVSSVLIAMVAVIGALAVATFASPLVARSVVGSARYAGLASYAAYFVLAAGLVQAFRTHLPTLLIKALLLAGSLEAVYGLAQTLGFQPLSFGIETAPVFGTMGNANFLAGFLAIVAPLALWTILSADRPTRAKALAAGQVAVSVVVIVATRSFQGIAAATAGLVFVGVAWALQDGRWRCGLRRVAGAPRAFALTVLLVLIGCVLFVNKLGGWAAAQVSNGLAPRLDYWSAAGAMIADSRWLGTGPETFDQNYASYYRSVGGIGYELTDSPHSVPLAMFTGGGALLGIAWLALVAITGAVLVHGLRRQAGERRLLLAGLGGGWLAYQVQSIVSIDIPPLALVHWALAAAICATAAPVRTWVLAAAKSGSPPEPGVPRRRRPAQGRPLPTATRIGLSAVAVVTLASAWLLTRPMRATLAAEEASSALQQGAGEHAMEAANRAVSLWPWDPRNWIIQGRVLERARRFPEARAAAERAASLAPGTSSYVLISAELARRAGDHEEALEYYRRAIRADPRDPALRTKVAQNFLTYGQRADALRLIEQGLRSEESAELWALKGLYHALEYEYAEATAAYRRALELDPTHQEALGYLAANSAG